MPKKYFISTKEDKLNRLKDAAFKYSDRTMTTRSLEEHKANPQSLPKTHDQDDFALNLELKADLERIYTVGEDGALRRPFRGTNLTDEQVMEILENAEGKYYYVKAGETQPMRIDNGYLMKPEEGTLPPAIEGLKNREVPPMEAEGRRAANDLWEMNRTINDLEAMFGESLGFPGTDNYRSYIQNISHHAEQAGGNVDYANSEKKPFTGLDFVALSMASMGDPQVSGENYGFADPEAAAYNTLSMLPADIYIHRVGNEQRGDWIARTRNATADAIRQYVEDGDPSLLAGHIARSIDNIGLIADGPMAFNLNAVNQMYPASMMNALLNNHPDLLEAAQKYARENGLAEQFQRGRENCRLAEMLIMVKTSELAARRDLATNPEMSEAHREQCKADIALSELVAADVDSTHNIQKERESKKIGAMLDKVYAETYELEGKGELTRDEGELTRQGLATYLLMYKHEQPKSALMGLLNEMTVGENTISRTGFQKVRDYIAAHDLTDGLISKTKTGNEVLESMKQDGLLSADGLDHSGTVLNRSETLKDYEKIRAERQELENWAVANGVTKEDALKSGLSFSEYAARKQAEAKLPPERRKPERPVPPQPPKELVEPKYENMEEPVAPKLSFGERFANFFKKLFDGSPIDKVARYEAERARYNESQARDQELHNAYSAAIMEHLKETNEYQSKELDYKQKLREYNKQMEAYKAREAGAEAKPMEQQKELTPEQRLEQAMPKLQTGTQAERVDAVADILTCATFQGEKPTPAEMNQFKTELMKTEEFKKLTENVSELAQRAATMTNGLKLGNELLTKMNLTEKQVVRNIPQPQKVKDGPQVGG